MKIFMSFEEAMGLKNPLVTTGSFNGVYAVSSSTGSFITKDMVLINTMFNKEPQVFLHITAGSEDISGKTTSLLFRKKITGPVNLLDQSSALIKLLAAKEEISELIY